MLLREKAIVVGFGAITLAVAVIFILAGTYVTDQLALAALILLCLVSGYVLVRSRHQEPPPVSVQEAEPDDTVWPPPPTKEPGVETPGSQ